MSIELIGNVGYATVRADDVASIELCEQLGLRGEPITLVRMRRADLAKLDAELASVVEVPPECDDDIERAFGLPAGRVAMARRAERVLVHLRDRELAVVGFAAFDPGSRTVAPLQVARVALLPALLASFGDELQLVVENDPALVAALCATGGEIRRQLVHYSGELTRVARQSA